LGYLAKEATIDSNTDGLLRAAIPPLLELKKLTTSRREASTGYVGMTIAFWTSNEYLRKSGIAQNRVQSAIDALALRVQVNTQVDVQKVLKKCSMLPNMDKKLDTLVAMAEESNKKLDQVLDFASQQAKLMAKQNVKDKVKDRKATNMDKYNIPSAACKKEDTPFATGSTCSVFKARWERQTVAVKVVSLLGVALVQRRKIIDNFMGEMDILVNMRHPNILSVFGIIDDELTSLQLVMEFASKGELGDYLRQSVESLPLARQFDFCLQVASGMRYLHVQKTAHRDLKSLNILITLNSEGDILLKISDFGLSKEDIGVAVTAATAGALGTPAWSAPEILEEKEGPDYFQSDLWSYGVVVWEIVTRAMPFEGMKILQVMKAVCMQGERMKLSEESGHHHALIQIVDGCCQKNPADRMSLDRVIELLGDELERL